MIIFSVHSRRQFFRCSQSSDRQTQSPVIDPVFEKVSTETTWRYWNSFSWDLDYRVLKKPYRRSLTWGSSEKKKWIPSGRNSSPGSSSWRLLRLRLSTEVRVRFPFSNIFTPAPLVDKSTNERYTEKKTLDDSSGSRYLYNVPLKQENFQRQTYSIADSVQLSSVRKSKFLLSYI
jgi:hypothetical protein